MQIREAVRDELGPDDSESRPAPTAGSTASATISPCDCSLFALSHLMVSVQREVINAVRRLGIEFVLDVAPASRKPALVTARAQKHGAIHHDDVSVVAASSA